MGHLLPEASFCLLSLWYLGHMVVSLCLSLPRMYVIMQVTVADQSL